MGTELFELLEHSVEHTLHDTIHLIPFLFITYLIMELLEHHTSSRTAGIIEKSGKFGPIYGSLLGVFPQCGFSTVASNLYGGRVITLGTLIAIYLSTSDEMLPILISEKVAFSVIAKILAIKVIIGILFGVAIDFIFSKATHHHDHMDIHQMCEHEHCHCERGVLSSSIRHTLEITVYLLLITFAMNMVIELIGEENLSMFLLNRPIIGELTAGIIGLIPNCAASVVITQLYLEGLLSFGAMLSGLLVGAGVGLLVLFKVNAPMKENFKIVGLLYLCGILGGILVNLLGIHV